MQNCKCPDCGASLSFQDDRETAFCEFCGARIILDDYRTTHRIVDEAKILEAENRKKELEMKERNVENGKQIAKLLTIIGVCFFLVGVVMCFVMDFNNGTSPKLFIPILTIFFGLLFGMLALNYATGNIPYGGQNNILSLFGGGMNNSEGGIQIPAEYITTLLTQDYRVAEANLKGLGFTNITIINLHDLSLLNMSRKGRVASVHVNGHKLGLFTTMQTYAANIPIVISYHGPK